ncbi:NADH dehydrogenase [ubiquinone] 1 beta subcomplex subunit 8, mitochondrial [Alligator sinensis]|uniref:NADH dehydrogenase [ubiquinone] 1 beta subcomplex subunit 8, mitochondrial n=1 Tax=Alligator sinensis TaxID=38654 RepID=A0A3Q0HGA8_ALLSI|nr:NADH dehydrogenase [ubiquinone] 1 beta subcomplex subunit 8, mitochondrial [Alligator sinensis]
MKNEEEKAGEVMQRGCHVTRGGAARDGEGRGCSPKLLHREPVQGGNPPPPRCHCPSCGDYPKLPNRSQEDRDPWYPWDDRFHRRNWGEPIHWDFDMFVRPRVDTTATMIPWKTMCTWFFSALAFMIFMFWVGAKYPSYMPVGPKQYPYNNLYLERGGDPNKEPPVVKNYEI